MELAFLLYLNQAKISISNFEMSHRGKKVDYIHIFLRAKRFRPSFCLSPLKKSPLVAQVARKYHEKLSMSAVKSIFFEQNFKIRRLLVPFLHSGTGTINIGEFVSSNSIRIHQEKLIYFFGIRVSNPK